MQNVVTNSKVLMTVRVKHMSYGSRGRESSKGYNLEAYFVDKASCICRAKLFVRRVFWEKKKKKRLIFSLECIF